MGRAERHDVAKEPRCRRGAEGEKRVMRRRLVARAGAVDLVSGDDIADDIAKAGVKADRRRRQALGDAVRYIPEIDPTGTDRANPFGIELVLRLKQDREGFAAIASSRIDLGNVSH